MPATPQRESLTRRDQDERVAVDDSPPLAVVVATRRRPDALGRLLKALRLQSLPRKFFSVIVVNDGSHDARYGEILEPHHQFIRYLSLV